jgi:hypothetical protein
MSEFKIYPLRHEDTAEIKRAMRDLHGNTPERSRAETNRSICRRCLRRFKPGDARILFKFRPFQRESVFAEVGPVYVHEGDCEPALDPLTRYPEEFRSLPLLLRAYSSDDTQVVAELIKDGDAEAVIDRFFADPQVAYIHLRDGEYGCYVARIERGT